MESHNDNRLAAIETILAEVAEQLNRSQAAAKKRNAEFSKTLKESQAAAKQWSAEFSKKLSESREEFDRKSDALNKQIKEVGQHIGGISNSNGLFAEAYFFNSFDQGRQTFFGEKFDAIKKNLKGTVTDDEFDMVMLNGHFVGLVEVKFKAHENDIPKVLKKASTFRANFPKYQNHKIYLGLATMAFYPELEEECVRQGIAVIKQVGDSVVINDKHLKVF